MLGYLKFSRLMTLLASAFLMAAFVNSPSYSQGTGFTLVGEKAPVAAVTDLSGVVHQIQDRPQGRPLYLKFWATWCIACREEMPHFNHVYETMSDQIDVIGINIGINDSPKKIARLQQKLGMEMPLVFDKDGDISFDFKVPGTPMHMVIDGAGMITFIGIGEGATENVELAIAAAISANTDKNKENLK